MRSAKPKGLAKYLACCSLLASLLIVMARSSTAERPVEQPSREELEFFEERVRPLLAEHCYDCHSRGTASIKAGLYLDSGASILRGGESGPAALPGDPEGSLLLSAVRYESFEMPPEGKLSDQQIEVLRRWIADGAYWPADSATSPATSSTFDWSARKATHWSWQAPQEHPLPRVDDVAWPRTTVDRFILARLESAGLAPAPEADRRSLARRLHFDLIGLPPTRAQLREFLQNDASDAYERRVDDLLASPHFGEKWARHWMDLVRYAETCGHEFDYPLQYAERYRDYLIRALNRDVPYDQLVREHVAGDLLPDPRRHPTDGYNESIIGTGFWFLGEAVHAPTDVRADEADRIHNQIDVMSKTFLGLTVGCARCHDHKFDPVSAKDYYALAGFLQSSRRQHALLDPHGRLAAGSRKLDSVRQEGEHLLRGLTAGDRSQPDWPAPYLRALSRAPRDGQSLDQVARDHELDVSLLKRFARALEDEQLSEATHPLFVWRRLVGDVRPENRTHFAAQRAALAGELRQQQLQAAGKEWQVFADFSGGAFDNWYATGQAFTDRPTHSGCWDHRSESPRLLAPGLAHSGLRSSRLQGVLRSPTFTLNHRHIHYRLGAQKVQLRLIVDGYVMDVFSPLLFADMTLKDVDTQGQVRWVTQTRDLEHYQGHRAHLEIIDHGDGYAAVEQIVFSNEPAPPDKPHPLVLQLVNDASCESADGLAEAYAKMWRESHQQLRNQSLDAAHTDLLNWFLKHRLVKIDQASLERLTARIRALQNNLPQPLPVLAMTDGDGEDERVHIRGNPHNLGEPVPRRMLVAIAGEQQSPIQQGSGRLQLARQMVDRGNPLVHRVLVNRVWHQLFGRGIVTTVDDLGVMGEAPSHPELLDWLARDCVNHGWSIKHVIRQLVMSQTYRMGTTAADPALAADRDPENRLWHRRFLRRLPAESIRDALLAVSGRLEARQYGASIPVHLTAFMEGRGRPASGPLDGAGRRSLYVKMQRNFLSPFMLTFDMPSPFSTMGRRSVSNVPAQSLVLMNDPFVWQQSELWARSLASEPWTTVEQRLDAAFEMSVARIPTAGQRAALLGFVNERARQQQLSPLDVSVWIDVCHALFNMKEFIYLP